MVKKRLLACVMATVVAGSLFVGCGGSTSSKGSDSKEGKELTIWTKVKDGELKTIEEEAKSWGEKTGNTVKVVNDEGAFQDYLQAANSSKGPDIYIGMPHDNLASFYEAGLLEEVPEDKFDRSKYATESVWDATAFDGENYGVPMAQETVALFYNKDKVQEVPKTMEELIDVAKKDNNGFQIDLGNFYITGGMVQTLGGYIFGGEQGDLKADDIGLASDGAVKGYEFLADLVTTHKLMSEDINGDIASANFKSGESAFYISGPWDVEQFEEAGLNFGIAPVPTIGGNDYKSFLGVQTAFVSSKSQNKDLAFDFLVDLVNNKSEELFKVGNRIPVLNDVLASDSIKENKYLQGFVDQSKVAIPMPNILEMQAVWNATSQMTRVYKGEDAKAVANDVVSAVKKGIETQQ